MKNLIIVIALTLFVMIDGHCNAGEIKVIASIIPLADFAKQVGGDRVEVKLLLPPGASPHTYEPTPKSIKDVTDAKVFIKIGAGLEFWAEKIVKASGNRGLIIVDSSKGIQLIGDDHSHHPSPVTRHPSPHSYADPHIWLDPVVANDIVTKIEKALIEADPANVEFYKKNASLYREKLSQLDKEISDKIKTFRIKEYVTFHPAWGYFSKRYGLRVAGVIEEMPGKEPSPKHVARIGEEVKRIGSRVIFAEPQFNPKIAEAIARESGARVLYLDPIGGKKGRETYIEMMRYNVSVMESVMK
ncbi:MAG: metal ABC transporter substrate-binding protein [Nitrospirota bacterium]|nr:metal ABC transporter substrate-binding protein [Nitrospirota bacterium]MDH5768336.1 metal ABC transporter substrate-binding protein [Nitrospirota bacterium]